MSLQTLPNEIIDQIVQYLIIPARGPPWKDIERAYLCNLALTCKTLNAAATPKLYEIVDTGVDTVQLIRTLASNPHLTAHIRQVNLTEGSARDAEWSLTAYDTALFNRLLRENTVNRPPVNGDEDDNVVNKGRGIGFFPDRSMVWQEERAREVDELATSLAAVLLALANKATAATYSSTLKDIAFYRPDFLSRLQCVSVYHWDTENACDLSLVQGILRAAPNVDHVHCRAIGRVSHLEYNPTIKKLDFLSTCIDQEALEKVLVAYPNLESLFYQEGDGAVASFEDHITPRQIWNALFKYRPKLRHLLLDFEELDNMYEEYEQEEFIEDHLMQSLSFMNTLESLHVHASYIYGEVFEHGSMLNEHGEWVAIETPDDGEFPHPPGLLVNFLPKSIRKLTISNLGTAGKRDLLELISVLPEKFPDLKHFTLAYSDPKLTDLLAGFQKQGVVVEVHDDINSSVYRNHIYECPHWLQGPTNHDQRFDLR